MLVDCMEFTDTGYLHPDTKLVYQGTINGYPVYTFKDYSCELLNWVICSKPRPYFPLGVFRSQDDMEYIMSRQLSTKGNNNG